VASNGLFCVSTIGLSSPYFYKNLES
jgi:hypothetical protein